MSNNVRLVEFDLLKGLGILFVILGHSVPDFPVNLRADMLSCTVEQVMYAFHMPLFFICAGCVAQMTDIETITSGGVFLKKKFLRLVVPYLCFSFFALALKLLFSSFTRSSVDLLSSISGILFEGKLYWFLYVMFEVIVTLKFLKQIKKAHIWAIAISFYLLGLYLNTNFMCLNRFGYYLIFTLIGMVCFKHKSYLDNLLQRWYVILLMVTLFISVFMLRDTQLTVENEISRFVLAICGTGVTYSICLRIKKMHGSLSSMLSYLGVISLPIYLLHMINQLPIYYFVSKLNLPLPILSVVMIFLITTIITYLMVKVMLRIPFCRYLIGMTPSKKH